METTARMVSADTICCVCRDTTDTMEFVPSAREFVCDADLFSGHRHVTISGNPALLHRDGILGKMQCAFFKLAVCIFRSMGYDTGPGIVSFP